MADQEYRCQAMTSKNVRCRNRAKYYRRHPDDGLDYLACDQHYRQEWFRPCGRGLVPLNPDARW